MTEEEKIMNELYEMTVEKTKNILLKKKWVKDRIKFLKILKKSGLI